MKVEGKTERSSFLKSQLFQKYFFIIVILIVPIANWVLFWLVVNVQSIGMAFQNATTGAFTWEHFQYFWQQLTSVDGEIGVALTNTLIYFSANLIIVLPLSIVMAFFLYKQIFANKIFMIIFYLPAVLSQVAMVNIYKGMFDINGPLAKLFGPNSLLAQIAVLKDPKYATWFIVMFNVWTGFGTNILLFIGAMARIPLEVFEAAKIEGCKPGRELISIIVPLIWPTFSTTLILSFTGLFASTGPILLFSNNDAFLHKTTTLDYWIFKEIYNGNSNAPHAVSATGLSFTLVAVPLIMFVRWLAERVPNNEY